MCLAVPTKVVSLEGNLATVDVQGVRTRVRLDALGERVGIGDYLLVHAGFAIRRLDPEDAAETLALFDELFALDGPHPDPLPPGGEGETRDGNLLPHPDPLPPGGEGAR